MGNEAGDEWLDGTWDTSMSNERFTIDPSPAACSTRPEPHPLSLAFEAALQQATHGKGQRHGGDTVPFYRQQWVTLADCHGTGFLTGQAAKKLNEAATKDDPEAAMREILGAINYAAMAWLVLNDYPDPDYQ